jgi:hypothetical protein
MILEPTTGVILHCSRCNTPMTNDDEAPVSWKDRDAIRGMFDDAVGEVYGWRQFGDRIVCETCQTADATGNPCERPEPLPAGEEDKVLRGQLRYMSRPGPMEHSAPIGMSKTALLQLLDDVRARVAEGDSFEGFLEYVIPEDAHSSADFDVRAAYRVGNANGQGGMRFVASIDDEVADDA